MEIVGQIELMRARAGDPGWYRVPTEYVVQKLVYENRALWAFADRSAAV